MAEKTINYIYEEMKNNDYLNKNTIYLDTNITTEVINILARQLTKLGEQELAKDKSKRKPIKIIISIDNGVKEAKLETALLKIYFNPLKLNKFSTKTNCLT